MLEIWAVLSTIAVPLSALALVGSTVLFLSIGRRKLFAEDEIRSATESARAASEQEDTRTAYSARSETAALPQVRKRRVKPYQTLYSTAGTATDDREQLPVRDSEFGSEESDRRQEIDRARTFSDVGVVSADLVTAAAEGGFAWLSATPPPEDPDAVGSTGSEIRRSLERLAALASDQLHHSRTVSENVGLGSRAWLIGGSPNDTILGGDNDVVFGDTRISIVDANGMSTILITDSTGKTVGIESIFNGGNAIKEAVRISGGIRYVTPEEAAKLRALGNLRRTVAGNDPVR